MTRTAGVGIVNAVEIAHAFPGAEGFKRFKDWVDTPDVAGALASASRRAAARKRGGGGQQGEEGSDSAAAEGAGAAGGGAGAGEEEAHGGGGSGGATPEQLRFFEVHRGVKRNWQVPATFPSDVVMTAYLQPRVDPNKARFLFGTPDHGALREFCW